jgi:hypothetical protein
MLRQEFFSADGTSFNRKQRQFEIFLSARSAYWDSTAPGTTYDTFTTTDQYSKQFPYETKKLLSALKNKVFHTILYRPDFVFSCNF